MVIRWCRGERTTSTEYRIIHNTVIGSFGYAFSDIYSLRRRNRVFVTWWIRVQNTGDAMLPDPNFPGYIARCNQKRFRVILPTDGNRLQPIIRCWTVSTLFQPGARMLSAHARMIFTNSPSCDTLCKSCRFRMKMPLNCLALASQLFGPQSRIWYFPWMVY